MFFLRGIWQITLWIVLYLFLHEMQPHLGMHGLSLPLKFFILLFSPKKKFMIDNKNFIRFYITCHILKEWKTKKNTNSF